MASDTDTSTSPDESLPGGRSAGRHAAPRRTVRGRMQVPVGRALALTAVPTALLMGTIAPKLALAADTTKTAPLATGTSTSTGTSTGTQCATPATTAGGTAAPQTSQTPQKTTTGGTAQQKQGGAAANTAGGSNQTASSGTQQSTTPAQQAPAPGAPAGGPQSSAPTAAPTPTPSATPTDTNPVTGLLNGLGGLLGLNASGTSPSSVSTTSSPSPSASPSSASPSTAAHTVAQQAVKAPVVAASSAPAAVSTPTHVTAPVSGVTSVATQAASSATPKATSSSAPASTAPATAHKMCDASHLAAPLDTSVIGAGEFPADPWTLKSTDLKLINSEFHGVVTVQTAAGPVRVLKFTAQEVNIGDLDMSVKQGGQRLHVMGGPGTTSTMRVTTVTMYVTSLSGTLKSAEGIPLGWLNVNLTLTPDTLPDWLFNLVGAVPIPLTLEFSNATSIQAGQVGGTLTIPGMHLYYGPLN